MRLFIVEDDEMLRTNLRLLLDGEAEIDVVGNAANAEDALRRMETAGAEWLLCDLGLPTLSGVELIRKLKQRQPELEVMAYSVFEDRQTVFAALKAGASSYILKGASPRELVEALFELRDGGAPMSPRIARAVIREFQDGGSADETLLSVREKQVLGGIERGLSYKEIGATLHVSPHTVHTHVKHIYEKLHARSRDDALRKARRKGLL